MTLSPTKRRAELLADALEHDVRTDDPELAPLTALATALAEIPAPAGPNAEFRTALRQRLVAVATVQGVGETRTAGSKLRDATSTWRFQRRVAGLAAGAAAVTAVAGVGIGASRSLPGDAFYGLKRATESVQLDLTFGQEAKGKRHLEFARTRLAEAKALAGEAAALPAVSVNGHWTAAGESDADTSAILSTLQDMDDETRAGAHDLFAAYRASGSAEPLQALTTFTQEQYSQLLQLLPELPEATRASAERSLSLLAIVRATTVKLVQPTPARPRSSHHRSSGTTSTSTPQPHQTPAPSTSSSSAPAPSSGSTSSSPPSTKTNSGVPAVPTVPPLPTSIPVPTSIPTLVPLPSLSSVPLLGG
jgi:hypothetical protein